MYRQPSAPRGRTMAFVVLASALACSSNPSAPSNLVAAQDPYSFDSVRISWTPSNGAVDGYSLEGRIDGEAWETIPTLLPATATGAMLMLKPDAPEVVHLSFRLRAVSGGSFSGYSNEAHYLRGVRPATGVGAMAHYTPDGISVSWQRNSLGADAVRVERQTLDPDGTRSAWKAVPSISLAQTSFEETDLSGWVDGAVYVYRVIYLIGSIESAPAEGQSHAARPSAPRGLAAEVNGGVTLTWDRSSRVATSFAIQRNGTEIATVDATQTRYTDPGLPPGGYAYSVIARVGNWSNVVNDVSDPAVVLAAVPDPAWAGALTVVGATMPPGETAARNNAGGWGLVENYAGHPAYPFVAAVSGASAWTTYRSGLGALPVVPGVLFDDSDAAHLLYKEYPSTNGGPCPLHHLSFAGTWQDEVVWTSACGIRASAAIGPTGALHALVGTMGAPLYYSNSAGTWFSEEVSPASKTFSIVSTMAVDPAGTPGFVAEAADDPLYWPVRYLLRRSPSGWTSEPLPADAAPGSDAVVGLLFPAADRALVFVRRSDPGGVWSLYHSERSSAGWSATTKLATYSGGSFPALSAAASPDGTRVAVVMNSDPAQLLLRGATGWTPLPLFPNSSNLAVGFTPLGKAWVLSGLLDGYTVGNFGDQNYFIFTEP